MKKILLITAFISIVISISAQNKSEYFNYHQLENGKWKIKPIENSYSFKGKKAGALYHNVEYFRKIICSIQKSSFTDEQIKYLCSLNGKGAYFTSYFDLEGNFIYGEFYFTEKMKKYLSEESLYKLYTFFQQSKLDTTKWGELYSEKPGEEMKIDFLPFTFPLGGKCSFCEQAK